MAVIALFFVLLLCLGPCQQGPGASKGSVTGQGEMTTAMPYSQGVIGCASRFPLDEASYNRVTVSLGA